MCDFIDTAHKAQEILLDRSILLDQMPNKEYLETEIKQEPKQTPAELYFNDDSYITEMEVSIDPMMILDNCGDSVSSSQDENSQSKPEDFTYLHGIDGESVTIKLIKHHEKSDSKPTKPESKNTNSQSEVTKPTEYTTLVTSKNGVVSVAESAKKDFASKPFPCIVCNRSFLNDLALKNHSWVHYNEDKNIVKLHICPHCLESFVYKCDLITHMKEHKSVNTCTICGRV